MYRRIILFFLIGYISVSEIKSQNPDINILRSINVGRNKDLDNTFHFISNTVTPLAVASPVIVGASGFVLRNDSLIEKGSVVAGSVLTASLIATGLKFAVNRKRPFVTYPFIEGVDHSGPYSFPSGHTSSAFSTATSLSIVFPKWYVIVPSYLWATSVGYSRMHLGMHYPSDVLAGAFIGAGSAYLSYRLNKYFFGRIRKSSVFQNN